jgi:3-hydroxyacyl-CoA dehydrogenase/enoyl-CoA hydratase/3-hydroxybutyryl-CoA epimerase
MDTSELTEQETVHTEVDANGLAALRLTAGAASAEALAGGLDTLLDARESLRGVVVTWTDGAAVGAAVDVDDMIAAGMRLRALERLGVPIVAAIDRPLSGLDAGVALAAHARLATAGASLTFPEVSRGLLPGLGSVARLTRLLGVSAAWDRALGRGRAIDAQAMTSLGLAVTVNATELHERALAHAEAAPESRQPWDERGFRIPGPPVDVVTASLTADLRRRDHGAPYPAPRAILGAIVEGSRVTLDAAIAIETRYLRELVASASTVNAAALGRDIASVRAGASRPTCDPLPIGTIAILGAGMMGRGIAYQALISGLEVRILDSAPGAASSAVDWVRTAATSAANAGRIPAEVDTGRITVADDYAALRGTDLVVEAIVEDLAVKRAVLADLEPHVAGALIASNTSSLPITALAEALADPSLFIGTHFFSPVDRMELLEIVVGRESSPTAVATAFDLGTRLGKTPIIVRDVQGFYTSRVIQARMDEVLAMIGEGIPGISIERASLRAGYPVGMLQFMDEVTLTLPRRVRSEARAAATAAGEGWTSHPAEAVMNSLIDDHTRIGRAAGGGFYDYEDGRRTRLWPGLREHFGTEAQPPSLDELAERLLIAESLAAATAVADGIVGSEADANVGTALGLAFPRWTGGALRYVRSFLGGPAGYLRRADELADRYGEHLRPTAIVREFLATPGEPEER